MNLINLFKKVTAIIIVLIIFFKVFVLEIYALSAAPIAAEALIEIFGTLLVASGVNTQAEVDEMSWGEVSSNVKDGLSSGTINPSDVIVNVTLDGVETQMSFMDWLSSGAQNVYLVSTIGKVALQNWIDSLTAEDVVVSYPDVDMKGYSAMLIAKNAKGNIVNHCYCEYLLFKDGRYYPRGDDYQICSINGGEWFEQTNHSYSLNSYATISVYGDVRLEDGTEVPVVGAVPEIGETADGESVTLDDVQSGEVSLDDVALDYDKFDDTAIIELVHKIVIELDKAPVIEKETDNTIAEDFSQELEGSVALELEDINALTLPTGIATVFPFCLPFDFAYGLELLAAKPVAPKFEIPFEIPSFGLYPGTSNVITLDMSEYSKYFEVGRWVQIVIFSIGLCFISFKVVKGVH